MRSALKNSTFMFEFEQNRSPSKKKNVPDESSIVWNYNCKCKKA